jgi:hypothetical protein
MKQILFVNTNHIFNINEYVLFLIIENDNNEKTIKGKLIVKTIDASNRILNRIILKYWLKSTSLKKT